MVNKKYSSQTVVITSNGLKYVYSVAWPERNVIKKHARKFQKSNTRTSAADYESYKVLIEISWSDYICVKLWSRSTSDNQLIENVKKEIQLG